MYINKKRRILKYIRNVINILCGILTVAVVGFAIYAFIGHNGIRFFPVVFRLGAVINILAGVKDLISDRKAMGALNIIFAIVLFVLASFFGTVIAQAN